MEIRGKYIRVLVALLSVLLGFLILAGSGGAHQLTTSEAAAIAAEPGAQAAKPPMAQSQPVMPLVGVPTNSGIGKRFQFPQELISRLTPGPGKAARPGSTYGNYVQLMDTWESITVDVPEAWNQVQIGDWEYHGQRVGRSIAASTDLEAFFASGNVPGLFLGASTSLLSASRDVALDTRQPVSTNNCKHQGVFDYQDSFYVGTYDYYIDCAGGVGSPNMLVLTTKPASQDVMVMLRMSMRDQRDLEAALKIFATYQVIGDVNHEDH